MKRFSRIFAILTCSFCGVGAVRAEAENTDLERKPLVIRSYLDFGQVVKGSNEEYSAGRPLEFIPIPRTGISVIQEADIQKKLNIKVGVGGLFWYAYPQLAASAHTQIAKFGPGIATANGTFKFGDPEDSWMKAQFGFFGYKYNPDAMNLGEYLYRSTTYPGILFTGGWTYIQGDATNNAAYRANGVRLSFSHLDGALNHDFTAFFETESFPILSISPGWNGSFKLGKTLEIGAGAVYQHLIPMKPSQLRPKESLNTYVRLSDFPAIQYDSSLGAINNKPMYVPKYRSHAGGPLEGIEQEIKAMEVLNPADSTMVKPYYAVTNGTDVQYLGGDDAPMPAGYRYVYSRTKEYLTFRGIKVMARASLDFKPMLGLENAMKPQDFKLFAEAAVLGVEDQPFYYDDITRRIPVMFGFNVPTLNLLDVLSLQAEYYAMNYIDSEEMSFAKNLPIPQVPNNNVAHHFLDVRDGDNWKWSIYARRNLFTGLNLYAQAASDHMRLQDFNARRSAQPVVNRPSEWYYLFRVEFGI